MTVVVCPGTFERCNTCHHGGSLFLRMCFGEEWDAELKKGIQWFPILPKCCLDTTGCAGKSVCPQNDPARGVGILVFGRDGAYS
eukprot:1069730-Amphidinium_carterae.1